MAELAFEIKKAPHGDVSAQTFREAYSYALWLLQEFDAAISGKRRGAMRWYIRNLSSNGALAIAFHSSLKQQRQRKNQERQADIGPKITASLVNGLEDIETKCIVPPYLSESGLIKTGELTGLIRKNGASGFRFEADTRSVEITERSSENIRQLLPIRRTAIGSVEGKLEAINLHKTPRFIVYHALTNKAVTCHFDRDRFLDQVKKSLGERVVVFGKLHKNMNGDTLRVTMDRLKPVDEALRFLLPSDVDLDEPSFARTGSTEEYLRRIRG